MLHCHFEIGLDGKPFASSVSALDSFCMLAQGMTKSLQAVSPLCIERMTNSEQFKLSAFGLYSLKAFKRCCINSFKLWQRINVRALILCCLHLYLQKRFAGRKICHALA